MIDFDDMEGQERALPSKGCAQVDDPGAGWEQRAMNRVMMTPSVSVDHSFKEDQHDLRHQRRQPQRIEVVVRHAFEGIELKVELPKRAKFKHIKLALARQLDSDEVLRTGHLMRKSADAYVPYRDESKVGNVREVLLLKTSLSGLDAESLAISVSDGELSPEEPEPAAEVDAKKPVSSPGGQRVPASAARTSNSGPTAAPGGSKASALPAKPAITRKVALCLQKELHEGFSQSEFQHRLAELQREHAGGLLTETEFVKRRKELLLTVQREVLPRYGFEGTLVGVFKMMAALGTYVKDPEFVQWATRINLLLGIDSPPETWGSLSKECKKLRMKDSRPYDEVLAAKATSAKLRAAVEHMIPADPWPAPDKAPPFKLSIVGSWSGFRPVEMQWRGGIFSSLVVVGPDGCERFQILLSGNWDKTIYPSVADATPFDAHSIMGPDKGGHGKNWHIGKGYPNTQDHAMPGAEFAIIAIINKSGKVKVVTWQELV